LQSRQVALGPFYGFPYAFYGAVADYGRSYVRPLLILGAVILMGAVALLRHVDFSLYKSLGLSLANTLNVFGFRKEFIDPDTLHKLPACIKVISGFQTIIGGALLFLVGLGLRNRFRMK
jgi:hypothetical protein